MAKRRTQSTSSLAAKPQTAPARPPVPECAEMDRLFAKGDYGGARRLADAALKDNTNPAVKERAAEIVNMTRLDPLPFALFGGMVLVLLIVFFNSILLRNDALKTLPSPVQVQRAMEPAPVKPPPQGGDHGTP